MSNEENIADKVSYDLYVLRQRLRDLVIHFNPSVSEIDMDKFVSKNMKMIDNELEKLSYKNYHANGNERKIQQNFKDI